MSNDNMGEHVVRRILEEYVQQSETEDICVFHNVLISFPSENFTRQYDHIVVSANGIVVIETKYWNGKTYIVSDKESINLLDTLLCFPKNQKFNTKDKSANVLIVNVKPPKGKLEESPYRVNFYSPNSILVNLREKTVRLKELLNLDSIIMNLLVFVENRNAKIEYLGKPFIDRFTEILISSELTRKLDYIFDELTITNDLMHELYTYIGNERYDYAAAFLSKYATHECSPIANKLLITAYRMASDDDKIAIDSILCKYTDTR